MVNHYSYNKRGWIRILEATIAIMIVSGVMIAVYSQQTSNDISTSEYFYNLQYQILSDIASRSDLRLNVLNTITDDTSDTNFSEVNNFINERIPPSLGYFIQICELGGEEDFCKMDIDTYLKTKDKNVFAEDIIISSDLGAGGGEETYNPKKLKLFIWEK